MAIASRTNTIGPAVTQLSSLPDGRSVQVTGFPELFTAAGSSVTSVCMAMLAQKMGGSPATFQESASVHELRSQFAAAGLFAKIEWADSCEDLAQHIELSRVVIAVLNAGIAWNDPSALGDGQPNHAVLVSSIARDPDSAELLGVSICDPTRPGERFVPIEQWIDAWLVPGGVMLAVGAH